MRVEVRLFATLVDFLPPHGRDGVVQLEVPDGSTVAEVTCRLGIPADVARVVLVNGRDVEPEQRLAMQDVVTIFPPLAGGGPATGQASRGRVVSRATLGSASVARSALARSMTESISAPTSKATPLQ